MMHLSCKNHGCFRGLVHRKIRASEWKFFFFNLVYIKRWWYHKVLYVTMLGKYLKTCVIVGERCEFRLSEYLTIQSGYGASICTDDYIVEEGVVAIGNNDSVHYCTAQQVVRQKTQSHREHKKKIFPARGMPGRLSGREKQNVGCWETRLSEKRG